MENVRGNIGDVFICVAVDRTADSMDHFVANLVVGKLVIEVPSNPYTCTIQIIPLLQDLSMMDLKMLWPTRVHDEKVLSLYSDAVAYVLNI